MAGMWDLPSVEISDGADAASLLEKQILARAGLSVELTGPTATLRHSVVGRSIRADVYLAESRRGRAAAPAASARNDGVVAFFEDRQLGSLPVSSLPLKVLRAVRDF